MREYLARNPPQHMNLNNLPVETLINLKVAFTAQRIALEVAIKTASGSGSATSQATQKAMQLLYDPDAVFKDMLVNGEFSTDEAALY
jgi:hypothetical protein